MAPTRTETPTNPAEDGSVASGTEVLAACARELKDSQERYELLLQVATAVNSSVRLAEIFRSIVESLRNLVDFERASITLLTADNSSLEIHASEPKDRTSLGMGQRIPLEGSASGHVMGTLAPFVVECSGLQADVCNTDTSWYECPSMVEAGMCTYAVIPLVHRNQGIGTFNLASSRAGTYDKEAIAFLEQLAEPLTVAVSNARAYAEIESLKNVLEQENLYLRNEVSLASGFQDIVGKSAPLKRILGSVERVAATDSTVLLRGETGTGKELLARSLHELSSRSQGPFIRVNCAALAEGVIASELFGHEKGAFTGAVAQRAGRFELAHGGTLFLDEIGEVPLDVQAMILRALQEKEIERVGGSKTLNLDVRLVAATNRDLEAAIQSGGFRSDLFFRLNVFPILVPPLRDRREDIELLTHFFVQRYARKFNRYIERIPSKVITMLENYDWPGNVRELENVIERAMILNSGPQFVVHESMLGRYPYGPDFQRSQALDDVIRNHILKVLYMSGGRIYGKKGAAEMLGMKPSTLQSKMKKLGIRDAATQIRITG